VLSDDSHGVAQVGLNYHRLFQYMRTLGASHYYYLTVDKDTAAVSFTKLEVPPKI